MKGYQITATGYWGKRDYENGGGKMTVSATFTKKKDALTKKKAFVHWAKVEKIPPYKITIEEVEFDET